MLSSYRTDFPLLTRTIHGKPLVYLDNAATTQKPNEVIQAVADFYRICNANVHRAAYTLAEEATAQYEDVRDKVCSFLKVPDRDGVVFTRGTTEGINLIAYSYGSRFLKEGDTILLSLMEHHSNIIPWQQLAQRKGAKLEYVQVREDGLLDQEDFSHKLEQKPKIVSLTHVSNVLGTINPIKKLVRQAKDAGACVVIDGAQAVPHLPLDITDVPCDFYLFSGHKMLGPTGVGVMYGRPEILEEMPPFLTGGEMIRRVEHNRATWNVLPHKFEAGTPVIAQAIGLGAAIDYLKRVGMEKVRKHEKILTRYALEKLSAMAQIKVFSPIDVEMKCGVISFIHQEIHAHDLATILDQEGVAIRSGHHCAQLLMQFLDVPATARISFSLYNTKQEVDVVVEALAKAEHIFNRV